MYGKDLFNRNITYFIFLVFIFFICILFAFDKVFAYNGFTEYRFGPGPTPGPSWIGGGAQYGPGPTPGPDWIGGVARYGSGPTPGPVWMGGVAEYGSGPTPGPNWNNGVLNFGSGPTTGPNWSIGSEALLSSNLFGIFQDMSRVSQMTQIPIEERILQLQLHYFNQTIGEPGKGYPFPIENAYYPWAPVKLKYIYGPTGVTVQLSRD